MTVPSFDSYYLIQPLVTAVISFIVAALVLLRARRNLSGRIFFCVVLSVGLSSGSVIFMRASPDPNQALIWDKAAVVTGLAIFVLYYHFTLVYTHKAGRTGLFVTYLVLSLAIALTPTDLLVERMRLEYYGYAPVLGYAGYLAVLSTLILMLAGAYNLLKRYRVVHSYEEKNRILYLIIAVLFPVGGGLLDGLTNLPPAGIWGNLVFCIICSVAIVKYHLLDISLIIRRGLIYILVSAVVALPYVGVLYFMPQVIKPSEIPWGGYVLILVVLAAILRPLYNAVQQFVDRLFYRERYDSLRALQNFIRQAHSITNLSELGSVMIRLVNNALRTANASLLLLDENQGGLIVLTQVNINNPPSEVVLRKDSPIVRWLEQGSEKILSMEYLKIVPQLQSLSQRESHNLEQIGAKLLVPIMTRSGSLSGILALGEKLSHQPYSHEDEGLLISMAGQMAMALENARLYDLQVKRYKEQALLTRLGMIVSDLDLQKVYPTFAKELATTISFDYLNINQTTMDSGVPVNAYTMTDELTRSLIPGDATLPGDGVYYQPELMQENALPETKMFVAAGIHSIVRFTLGSKTHLLGTFSLASRRANAYNADDLRLLQQVAIQLSIAIEKSRLYELERKALHELENQDKERTDFVNALVHEIKTPLTAMLASSELLKEELSEDASPLGSLANNMDTAAHNLHRRINELTDFAKLQRAQTVLYLEKVDINKLARDVAKQVNELYQLKKQTLNVRTPDSPTFVKADPDRITQVLFNLLTNASKYSGEQKIVQLISYVNNGNAVVEVKDTGTPLAQEELSHLFTPYYHDSPGKGSGGLGLGLFISKKLIELHSGTIWIEPQTTGNSFKFSLPLMSETGG